MRSRAKNTTKIFKVFPFHMMVFLDKRLNTLWHSGPSHSVELEVTPSSETQVQQRVFRKTTFAEVLSQEPDELD